MTRERGPLAELRGVVTGGSSGIGQATACLLKERGAHVVSLDLVAPDEPLAWVLCDVASSSSVNEALSLASGRLGGLDIVINNAGVGAVGSVEDNPEGEWAAVLNVNLVGIARVSRAAIPLLRQSEHAAIVNTGSIAGSSGLPNRALYSATKGAVHALTLAMAADCLADGIRVNAVAPGTADTPWVERLLDQADNPEAERVALERRQPLGRLVTADEVAEAICYLASPAAGSTTGTILAVDGGMRGLRVLPPT